MKDKAAKEQQKINKKNRKKNNNKNKTGGNLVKHLIAVIAILNLIALFAFDYQIPFLSSYLASHL